MIQLNPLDDSVETHGDSAETLGRFTRNYWMIQLKLLNDSAETLGDSAETLR
jgi:hypothetical protein